MSKRNASCPSPDVLVALDEGVLPDGLRNAVQEHLSGCPICQTLQQDLQHPMFAEPAAAELNNIRTRLFARRWSVGKLLATAAGVILVVSLYPWLFQPSGVPPQEKALISESKAAPSYRLAIEAAPLRLPFSTAMVLRGKGESTSQDYLQELGKALGPYRSEAYADAAVQLGELRARYPKAVEAPFYQGVARLLAGDFKGALEPLEAARAIGGEALNDDIAWYLAAAHERNGEWLKTVRFLESLCGAEGVHRVAACSALGKR